MQNIRKTSHVKTTFMFYYLQCQLSAYNIFYFKYEIKPNW